jgi:hypothetical protein
MRWAKRGVIYAPDGSSEWAARSALQPTPLRLSADVVRLFVGFRDAAGVGRIGYIDVDADNPSRVLGVSRTPVLDVGEPGTFDDNGVIPSAVARHGDRVYLHYAGYQLGVKVRFTVLGGLAVSDDSGHTFRRVGPVPALERTPEELFFRVAHTAVHEGGRWRVWYGGGNRWIRDGEKTLPVYDIRYLESADGVTFPRAGRVVMENAGPDEHRVARPYVIRHGGLYKMFYSVGTRSKTYRLGYAESIDGLSWRRMDAALGLDVSPAGWDSRMMAYSSVVLHGERAYLFYNGNDYGASGVGYAELESW